MSEETNGLRSTTDIALMAFYQEIGQLELVKVKFNPRARSSIDCIFYYNDPEDRSEELRIQWVNHPFQRFDSRYRSLRKLCFEARKNIRTMKHVGMDH